MSETTPSGKIEQLEKLALALAVYPFDLQASSPRLFPGKIPENFPIEIPLPEQAHVLGTLVRSETQVEIVLESGLPSQEILDFYRTHLASLGWQEPEEIQSRHEGGFLHRSFATETNSIFCQQSSGAGLTLQALPLGSTTTVRLNISLERERNPCAQLKMHHHHHRLYEMIPSLTPPAGAQQRGGGGGSSSDEAHTTATLKTDLALDVLAQHYADQLSQAGWTQTNAGTSGPSAWHTWHFTSEDQESWNGMFFILKTPEKSDEYFTFIRAAWTPSEKNQAFTGWLKNS